MKDDDFISAGEPIPRLASVQAGAGKSVLVTWEDGASVIIDLAPYLLRHKGFEPLADNVVFAQVQLDQRGIGICWPGLPGAGISAETLEALADE